MRIARLLLFALLAAPCAADQERPNILWVTAEDHGPHLGCYGDPVAHTPVLDGLAAEGARFRRAWSNAPVCAPARTTLITGMYATSLGAEAMRSNAPLPGGVELLPQLMRRAGYHCTNRQKTDYNLEGLGEVWDASSARAHWRDRAEGQPFFAVFNIKATHESRIRSSDSPRVTDPAGVRVPAYHPDHPDVRRDWARYHDNLAAMDAEVGALLAELEADGLAGDTVVFFFSDHGAGLPRCKRFAYDSGLRVPLIVRFPERFRHLAPEGYAPGAELARLVSFVDLAPTVLSLAGLAPPEHMQGAAFAGERSSAAPQFLFGFRGRMDERIDLVRSVTDGRYVYVRNLMPHRPNGQFLQTMFKQATTLAWREVHDAGETTPAQARFWEPRAHEELYDLATDPDEVVDLARAEEHRGALVRLRGALRAHVRATGDLGVLPESELHRLADPSAAPLDRVWLAAELASSPMADADLLRVGLQDGCAAVRYWAATGLDIAGARAVGAAQAPLLRALVDPSPAVRVSAASALARHGSAEARAAALPVLVAEADLAGAGLHPAIEALNALASAGELPPEVRAALADLPREAPGTPGRLRNYVPRLLDRLSSR